MDYALFVIERRLNKDNYKNNKDRQKDINDIIRLKQNYIDNLRNEIKKEEIEKYRFLHKYTDYNMNNELKKKRELLEEKDWSFNYSHTQDIDLMVETRDNTFMYGLFNRIGSFFIMYGIGGLGNYDDIRERTIIDNIVELEYGLTFLENMFNDKSMHTAMSIYLNNFYSDE